MTRTIPDLHPIPWLRTRRYSEQGADVGPCPEGQVEWSSTLYLYNVYIIHFEKKEELHETNLHPI